MVFSFLEGNTWFLKVSFDLLSGNATFFRPPRPPKILQKFTRTRPGSPRTSPRSPRTTLDLGFSHLISPDLTWPHLILCSLMIGNPYLDIHKLISIYGYPYMVIHIWITIYRYPSMDKVRSGEIRWDKVRSGEIRWENPRSGVILISLWVILSDSWVGSGV